MSRPLSAAFAILLAAGALAQELPLTRASYVAAPSGQENPQIASDGTNFLVAWRDGRRSVVYQQIFAARVSPDGRLLDEPTAIGVPDGHDTTPTSSTNLPPAVVWTGRVYIVAWVDKVLKAMQFVRIDRDGLVLDARPGSIAGIQSMQWGAAASTGDGALIVASASGVLGAPIADSVYATTFDVNGEIVNERIPFSRGFADLPPVIAANGEGYMAAWLRWTGSFHRLVVAPVSRAGIAGPERTVGVSSGIPVIASNGGDFLVAYTDRDRLLVTERLDASGNAIAHSKLSDTIPLLSLSAAMVPYGSDYLFAYTAFDATLHALLLDRNGNQLGTRSLNQSGRSGGPIALASSGTATAAAWQTDSVPYDRSVFDVYARVLDVPGGETLLSRAARTQSRLRVAPSANGYLGAFVGSADQGELRVARLTANGAPLDAVGIHIDNDVHEPAAVAFDGRNNVILYTRQARPCEVRINRVAPDGGLLDGPGGRVLTAAACSDFGAGGNGSESLLVWSGTDVDSTPVVFVRRMRQDGTLIPPAIRIPARNHFGAQFAVAWTRGMWLVAWRESQFDGGAWMSFPQHQQDILAVRISETGFVLDAVPIVIAETPFIDHTPAVASNGSDFLVAWRELRNQTDVAPVRARHIGLDGVAGPVIEVAGGEMRRFQDTTLSLVARGANYIAAWNGSSDVFYSLVGSGVRLPLAVSADEEREVTLLPSAFGFAAFYERVATENLYGGVPRAFVRFSEPRTRAVRR